MSTAVAAPATSTTTLASAREIIRNLNPWGWIAIRAIGGNQRGQSRDGRIGA